MDKHSPWPWKVRERGEGTLEALLPGARVVEDSSGNVVALILMYVPRAGDGTRANADLTAASPEMLELLRRAHFDATSDELAAEVLLARLAK